MGREGEGREGRAGKGRVGEGRGGEEKIGGSCSPTSPGGVRRHCPDPMLAPLLDISSFPAVTD